MRLAVGHTPSGGFGHSIVSLSVCSSMLPGSIQKVLCIKLVYVYRPCSDNYCDIYPISFRMSVTLIEYFIRNREIFIALSVIA